MVSAFPSVTTSERLVLDLVRRHEPVRRSVLHTHTALTQPSVHRLVDRLVAKGLVRLGPLVVHGPGKPSPELHLDRRFVRSIGVSVNTDAITLRLVDLACEPLAEACIDGRSAHREDALTLIAAEVGRLLVADGARLEQVAGVCLALPAYFVGPGLMSPPSPLADWGGIDLRRELAYHLKATCHLDVACHLENNATTAAIGESLVGVGRWASSFAYLSFNYGFGGGVIVDGQPYRGAHGNAMEISRLFTDDELGHRPALALLIDRLQRDGIDISSVQELRARFDPGWAPVEDWINDVLPALNRAVWAISAVVDPEAIVLGGELPDALGDRLVERIARYATTHHRGGTPIPAPLVVRSEVPGGAALGAALVPLKAALLP